MGLTLVTAVYGDYDDIAPLPADHGFDDAVLVTGSPDLAVPGWRTVYVPGTGRHRLDAKTPKLAPWRFMETDASVWIDGSAEVVDGGLRAWIDEHPLAELRAWPHPEPRSCLYDEATYCQDWPKYAREPLREQTASYRAAGMPEQFGLWACGTLYWRHTARAKAFGEAWLLEQYRWSIQDQVSLPFLLWSRAGQIDFGPFAGHEYANPFLRWRPHRRDT